MGLRRVRLYSALGLLTCHTIDSMDPSIFSDSSSSLQTLSHSEKLNAL